MPLYRRIPKRGFNNKAFRTNQAAVNVDELNEFPDGTEITLASLQAGGLASRKAVIVKILGDGELKRKLTVKAQRFSASAREKITKAGGQCVQLPLPGATTAASTEAA